MTEIRTIDATPDPRVLQMLGEIPLKDWQCVAEFIDNAIDGVSEIGLTDNNPDLLKIIVNIPSPSDISRNNKPLVVEDSGVGMREEELEKSVKAGYSGKRHADKLGLFGMGFNVASARLANKVSVWTSTKESEKSIGVVINFKEMIMRGSFTLEVMESREHFFSQQGRSGTRIEVSNFKNNISFQKGRIVKELKKAYSSSLFEKYHINLVLNDEDLFGKQYCTWDHQQRYVEHSGVRVPTRIEIPEYVIRKVAYCTYCLNEIGTFEGEVDDLPNQCNECQTDGNIEAREYKISGWIGIQRFFHENLYGIDIVRNGRIIVANSKEFFNWECTEEHNLNQEQQTNLEAHGDYLGDDLLKEYPIDNEHIGGRIVGEVYVDFIKPYYTKNNFDRDNSTWKNAIKSIRGSNPMQQNLARDKFGLTEINDSPLANLFRAYRKTDPGLRNMVCGGRDVRVAAANITAQSYYHDWLEGNPDFKSDEKWYELVLLAERSTDDSEEDGTIDVVGGPDYIGPDTGNEEEVENFPGEKLKITEITVDLESKTRVSPKKYIIFEWDPTELTFQPLVKNQAGSECHVYMNNQHTAVNEFPESWKDLFSIEVAHEISTYVNDRETWTPSAVYLEIKKRYFPEDLLDQTQLQNAANGLVNDIIDFFATQQLPLGQSPSLTDEEKRYIKRDYLSTHNRELSSLEDLTANTGFIKYASKSYIFKFISDNPETLLDENFFVDIFRDLEDDDLRMDVKDKFLGNMSLVKWLITFLPTLSRIQARKNKAQIINSKFALNELTEKRIRN